MLIAALILAVIGLAALITAVATSNELIAWVCIGASSLGIVLLIVDAIREQFRRPVVPAAVAPAVVAGPEAAEVIEQVAEAVVVEDEVVEDEVEGEAWDEVADESSYGAGDFADESDIVSFDVADSAVAVEDHPDEVVHDEPAYDLPTDDEVEFPEPAEVAALHIVSDDASVEYPAVEYVAEESATEEYVAVEYVAVEYAAVESASVEYAAVEYASVDYPAVEAVEYVTAAEGETAAADAHDTAVTEEYVVETVENHLGSDDADSTTEIRYVPSAEGSADTVYTYSKGSETEYIEAQESGVTHGGQ